MPGLRARRSRSAPAKNGCAEYMTTGTVSRKLAQRIRCSYCHSMSPGAAV
ncbi:MAG: hypothetical protein U1E86_16770 [Burkholderiaceae bacterium]